MYEDISNNIPKKVKILIDLKAVKQACHLNVSCLSDLCDSSSKCFCVSMIEIVMMKTKTHTKRMARYIHNQVFVNCN
jgi:hypothetical protein